MITARENFGSVETHEREVAAETLHERWAHWPIHWSGIWVGALATLAAVLLFGLIGIALGAHVLDPAQRVVDLKKIQIGALVFLVFGAFLSFALGGWVAGKVAGILRSEPAMLHGAIVWLLALPILLLTAGLGAGTYFGSWYGGLASTPSWAAPAGVPIARPDPVDPGATAEERMQYRAELAEYHRKVEQWNAETPKVTRNSALGTLTALLLGLVGSVIGGWLASGEPMTFTHYRTRKRVAVDRI